MPVNDTVNAVTQRIGKRSKRTRDEYLLRMRNAANNGPKRAHLTCGNQAHAYAASDQDKHALANGSAGNIGIITAFNDMLSAHQPFETYPEIIKSAAREAGGTAQVAGGVPAMCDGVTQGQPGMELSLFSRDVIALSASVALSHNVFDSTVYLGVCDKIIPGLVIAAASFGHLPAVFLPAGPMSSGLPNDEKSRVRRLFAEGQVTREELLKAEMDSYHGPGTCTFYGTANSNQMLMEVMGLQLPGSSFVNPGTELRHALTVKGTNQALAISALTDSYTPICDILSEATFVNGIVGLMATGGSTNLLLHLIAMARAAGIILDWQDFSDLSEVTPLIAKVYPNGMADVNHFHAAGGLGYLIGALLEGGLLHYDTQTIVGRGLANYTNEPRLSNGKINWIKGAAESLNTKILTSVDAPFQATGGIRQLGGNLGRGVMKTSAVAPEHHVVRAPVRIFHDQPSVKTAFQAGELDRDVIVVVRFQGPRANGMPELHNLTPLLTILQGRGHSVALVTDGRMSGASGKVPSAIHVCPEAAAGGPLAKLKDGDILTVDAKAGVLRVDAPDFDTRVAIVADLSDNTVGMGRELFEIFRQNASGAETGACPTIHAKG